MKRIDSNSPRPASVIDELFQRLTTLSSKLESAVELSSLLQGTPLPRVSSARGELVMPWGLSADLDRPRQRQKRSNSSRRSSSRGHGRRLEIVDRGAESKSSMTLSTHPSLGECTPSRDARID